MEEITINNKKIYIVPSHNHALQAWESGGHQNVFSLDYHTDTREAFLNYSYWKADSEIKSGRCRHHDKRKKEIADEKISQYLEKRITIKQVNDNLKHDEHLDFAVRTNIIEYAFVLSKNSNESSSNPNVHIASGQKEYKNQRIIEFSPPCVPGCEKASHDEACRIRRADSSIEDSVLGDAAAQAEYFNRSFFNTYVLDLDCDYFNTEKSLYPENIGIFHKLIRGAQCITIALEHECVKICRHEGSRLNSEKIVARLISIIENA